MPKHRPISRPIILGIVGDSAAGKTTLAAGIAQILGSDRVAMICTDDYHRYSRAERTERNVTALSPDANYIDILEQHLALLRAGKPILKPNYNHHGGTLDAPTYVEPKDYIIIEGLLGYSTRAMRDCYDVKVYLDPEENLRVNWKIQRDTAKRGYNPEQVKIELEKRRCDTEQFIRPQRAFADIVVRAHLPQCQKESGDATVSLSHMLRPTLPHPDLTPVLQSTEGNGLRFELARDEDSKPVDLFEISEDITEEHARETEDLLWGLIPEAAHMRDNVGIITDGKNKPALSHPQALSQLFITFHIVKAAMGIHAI